MTKRRIVRSILSVFLSLVLIINGFLPGMPFVSTVHAESTTKTITPGTDDAKTGTGTMEISLTIKKTPSAGDFTFTSPTSLIYDGQAKAATVSAEAEGMGEVTVEYYNGDTKLSGAPTAEGTYTVKVNVAEGDDYKAATGITDDDWTFTILPMQKTMTITLVIHGHEFTYGAEGATITATCGSTVGTCDLTDKKVSFTLNAPEKKKDTDSLSASATLDAEELAAFNKATGLSVKESDIEYYEGTTKLAAAPTTEGNYTAKLTVGTGDNKATAEVDYSIGTTTQTHSMNITLVIKEKAKITTAPKANELTYTGKAQELVTAGVAQNGTMQYKLGETGTYSDKIPTATDTGKYKVYYKAVKASEDYLDSDENSVEVSIEKAANTVSVSIDDWTYGGTASVPTATADFGADTATFTYSDTEDGTYTSTVPTKVGTYYVKVTIAGTDNYEAGISDPVEFAIKKAALTVTAEAKNITYGDEDVPLTYKVSGLAEGDTADKVLTGALARETGTDAGTYKITQGSLVSDDYSITFVGADYVIAKKSVKVSGITASNKVYDGTNAATISTDKAVFDGKVGTDTLTVTATGLFEDGNAGESKKVTISGLTLGGESVKNYELAATGNQTEATADITKKTVVVTPDADRSKVYGAADPAFTYKATGLVGEEELKGSLARVTGETVGEYAYTIGSLESENVNYSVSIAEGAPKFEIKKAALTVTADAKNITYGDADVALTYSVEGLTGSDKAEDVLTGALTREAGTDAGTYKITQGSLTSADYGITFVGADYVIAKAAQAAPAESFTTSKSTGSDTSDGKISGFAAAKAYQISSDNGATWTDVEASSTSLDVKAGDYRIRYAGDKNHEAGASVSVTVGKKADQSKPEGLETENVSTENATDGVVTGVTDAMEYSTDDGKTWTAVPANANKIDGLAAGEVLVRYAKTDDKNASPAATVVVGVASRTEGEVKFKPDADGTNIKDKAITGVDDSPNESLDEFAKTQKEAGKDVKVEVEITPVKEDKVTAESVTETKKVVDDVFKGINKEKVVTEYLEIDVAKYVNNERENDTISDTNKPIEIPLKYNTTKGNPVVIRTHEGVAKAFGKLKSRPAKKDYKDAMFYIDLENEMLYIYSQYFSDFAIVYATETTYNVGFVSGTSENLSPLVVAEGGKVTLPTGLKNDGYAFDGWYQDEAYKTAWKDSDTVYADITLYAKWNKSVSGVSVSPSEVKFTKAGETSQIKTTVTPADAANTKVTYKSSDTKVATVDANGKITAVANGTATITVTTEDGAKTATVKVTVSIPEVKQQGTEEPVQQPTEEEKAVISMNAGLKISQTGSKINIKWGKVGEADGYDVYVAYCGKKFGKAVKTINKNSTTSITVKKINGKKINLKNNFKVYVAAYKMTDGKKEVLAKSIMGHAVGRLNTKYSNAKKITLSKSKYSVKVGKTVKVKAKTVLVDKSKKQLSDGHAKEFRYATSNKNIATVDNNGKVKGVAKGTCTIYVYARNGYAKTVKVTVK